jgi:hypothetical protein
MYAQARGAMTPFKCFHGRETVAVSDALARGICDSHLLARANGLAPFDPGAPMIVRPEAEAGSQPASHDIDPKR